MATRRNQIEPLLVGVLLLAVLLVPMGEFGTRYPELLDLAHLPLFAFLAWYVQSRLRRAASPFPLGGAFVVCAGVALATEFLQSRTGRSASASDMETDLLAAAATLLWLRAARPHSGQSLLLRAVALAAILIACWPAGRPILDRRERARSYPLLLQPGTAWSLRSLDYRDARMLEAATDGILFEFGTARHAAVFVRRLEGDWRAYRTLVLELQSEMPLELMLRVDDRSSRPSYRDRFERAFAIPAGPYTLRIDLAEIEHAPRSQPIDLGAIETISLFLDEADAPRKLRLRGLRLEDPIGHDRDPTTDSSR